MIDLIKKIEKLKLDIEKHNELWASGVNCGIYQCQKLLNQYNIITAPKEIKLSEIVERLNEFYATDEYIVFKENNKIYIHSKYESHFEAIIDINIERKIENIQLYYIYDELKWLYTLWIAGTTIIDDLEAQDEQH